MGYTVERTNIWHPKSVLPAIALTVCLFDFACLDEKGIETFLLDVSLGCSTVRIELDIQCGKFFF